MRRCASAAFPAPMTYNRSALATLSNLNCSSLSLSPEPMAHLRQGHESLYHYQSLSLSLWLVANSRAHWSLMQQGLYGHHVSLSLSLSLCSPLSLYLSWLTNPLGKHFERESAPRAPPTVTHAARLIWLTITSLSLSLSHYIPLVNFVFGLCSINHSPSLWSSRRFSL